MCLDSVGILTFMQMTKFIESQTGSAMHRINHPFVRRSLVFFYCFYFCTHWCVTHKMVTIYCARCSNACVHCVQCERLERFFFFCEFSHFHKPSSVISIEQRSYTNTKYFDKKTTQETIFSCYNANLFPFVPIRWTRTKITSRDCGTRRP